MKEVCINSRCNKQAEVFQNSFNHNFLHSSRKINQLQAKNGWQKYCTQSIEKPSPSRESAGVWALPKHSLLNNSYPSLDIAAISVHPLDNDLN